ncbi:hypothetical protein [Methylobacterium oryzae]|uniref:hypothetical protein n=1 Tax=Methylobacterium oryzae TaxID=334852 RepID=UPI002F35535B
MENTKAAESAEYTKKITTKYGIEPKDVRRAGFHFALGILDAVCVVLVIGIVLSFLLSALMPPDDCDRGRFDRCGMKVLTDAKTGQEYLVTPEGGIIERKGGAK